MFNLRATAKLLRRLKLLPSELGETTTRLGDWYANLFYVGRQQFSLFTSDRCLLSLVLPAKEIHTLPNALIAALRALLLDLKVPSTFIEDELARMQLCLITTTASRSILGSMNDFTFATKLYLSDTPPLPLPEINLRLAEVPMSAIGYRFPIEVALDLLSCTPVTNAEPTD